MFKKKQKPYPRSFANRLTWRVMLTVLIVMGFISFGFFMASWTYVTTVAHFLAEQYLEGRSEAIRRSITEVHVASVNTVPRIEESLGNPDKLYDIMESLVRQNPSIRSCGLSFIADYYPKKGHWFCPYALRPDSGDVVVNTIGDKQHDYLQAEWFKRVIASDSAYWSKPFFDGQDKTTPLVSWMAPIHNAAGQTVAILGVDLSLVDMAEKLRMFKSRSDSTHRHSRRFNVNIESDGNAVNGTADSTEVWDPEYNMYIFAIDGHGTYLVHPDQRRVVSGNYFTYAAATPDSIDDHLGHRMVNRQSGYFDGMGGKELIMDGENVFVEHTPVEDSDWSVAWVIPKIIINIVSYVICSILAFFILLGLFVMFFAGRRSIKKATKSLKQLSASADEVAKGNFNTRLPVIKSRDEIHQLRDSFEKMQHSLKEYIAELKTTTAQKASMESELKVAHDIQMSMLPKTFPPYPERNDIDIYGTLTPAKDVGGDLFDFFIRNEQLYFCIGDVSGKGVPASLFMAVTRSLFRNISAHVSAPAQIVGTLNKAMAEGNETSMFVTLFVGVLDLTTGRLAYCNAGHDAPLILGKDVCTLPCNSNLPIGVLSDMEYSPQEAVLSSGSTIFLFTDGLNEAENTIHAQFGDRRIADVAAALSANGQNQPVVLVNAMSEAVSTFVGDAEQSDDMTMLAIQYKRTCTDEQ